MAAPMTTIETVTITRPLKVSQGLIRLPSLSPYRPGRSAKRRSSPMAHVEDVALPRSSPNFMFPVGLTS